MRLGTLFLLTCLSASLTLPSLAATHRHRATSTSRHVVKSSFHPPRGIDDARATEIQEALIKAGYLSGTPSGHWDSESQAAMQKVQADNGWQTKLVPDSRALIKLGLGPNNTASPEALNNHTSGASSAATDLASDQVPADAVSTAR